MNFRAADGAGNAVTAQADGEDRPHAAGLTATASRTPSRSSHVLRGRHGRAVRPDRARLVGRRLAPRPRRRRRTFTVAKGKVVSTASDAAGNAGVSAPVVLADRTPPPRPSNVTPRSSSEAVSCSRARPVLRGSPRTARAVVHAHRDDGRPAAARARQGHVPARHQGQAGQEDQDLDQDPEDGQGLLQARHGQGRGGRRPKVTLTVKRKSGKRWVTHATASATCKSG